MLVSALLRGLAVLMVVLGLAMPAAAADPPAPATVNVADLERLVTTLEDPQARGVLVAQLKTLIESERARQQAAAVVPAAPRILDAVSDSVSRVGRTLYDATVFIADAPRVLAWLQAQAQDADAQRRWLEVLAMLTAVLIGGLAAEALVRSLVRPVMRRIEGDPSRTVVGRELKRAIYFLLGLAPIVAFAAASFAILAVIGIDRVGRLVAVAFVNANLMVRAIALLAGVILVPRAASLRPLPISDHTAAYMLVWIRRLSAIAIYGYFAASAALLIGLPRALYIVVIKSLGVIVALLLVMLVLQNRAAVAQVLGSGASRETALGRVRRIIAKYWHVVAILYVSFATLIWLLDPAGGIGRVVPATIISLAVIGLAVLVNSLLSRAITRMFRVSAEIREQFPDLEARTNRYLRIFNVVAALVVTTVAAVIILQAWGLRSLEWFATPVGRRLSGSVIAVTVAVAVAIAIWESISFAFDRYALKVALDPLDSRRRRQRLQTLRQVAERILGIVLVIFVGLVMLSEIGVNIGPLLAGAGVVGLAVGLGAQTLIRDLIGGVSLILEDVFAVGDVVKVGEHSGVVEWMSLKTLRLRAGDGSVHSIPFSELKTITNMTRDYAYSVFDIAIDYGSDADKAAALVNETGLALRRDPEVGRFILSDPENMGIDRFTDAAIIVKSRIKTLPGKQWPVSRAFNRDIRHVFDQNGIRMASLRQTVVVVDRGGPDAAQAEARA